MIIWAASWPRCGSTLWRIVWHTYTGLPTFSYANDPILAKGEIVQYVGQRKLPYPYEQMHKCDSAKGIYMIKVHLYAGAVDPENTMRKMVVVRDVRDAIVSLANYTSWRKHLDYRRELERVVRESTWLPFNNSWRQLSQAVVKYEDLVAAPRATFETALSALDVDIELKDNAEMPTFRELHKMIPRFFRRGKVGGWRKALTRAQEERIWKTNGWLMEELGYNRKGQA